MVAPDGKIMYISETASVHLGLSQVCYGCGWAEVGHQLDVPNSRTQMPITRGESWQILTTFTSQCIPLFSVGIHLGIYFFIFGMYYLPLLPQRGVSIFKALCIFESNPTEVNMIYF